MDNKEIMNSPIHYVVSFMFFTLLIYLLGPIDYFNEWNWYECIGLIFVIIYIIALSFGYHIGLNTGQHVTREYSIQEQKKNEDYMLKILGTIIIIDLVMTTLNAFLYVGVSNFSSLWNSVLNGLLDPAGAYYGKDVSSRSGNIVVYITLLLNPIMYVARVNALLYWKKLSLLYRIFITLSILMEAFRWLAVGTNKGLFDIIVMLFSVFIIKQLNNKYNGKTRKLKKKYMILLGLLVIAFLSFFSYAISSRIGGVYEVNNFSNFPYNLIPEQFRVLVEKVDSYLTQGYANMIKCMQYCKWKPTFFIGNSRFLLDMLNRIMGIDLTGNTYPYQLATYGVDPLASWHTAYAWWASDVSFIGVIFVMFVIGMFFGRISKESIMELNPVSCTLFYMVLLGLIFASCNNCVLAYSNMWCGCIGLIIYRFCKRYTSLKHIRIVFRKKK